MRARDIEPFHGQFDRGTGRAAPECKRTMLSHSYRNGMVGRVDPEFWRRLAAACTEIRTLGPRETFSRAGEPLDRSALLLEGFMVRYIVNEAATLYKRALVSIQVPGDFIDLHGLPTGHLDHDVGTLTAARIALFPHRDLHRIMEASASHARMLWQLTMIDASIHRHWLFRATRLRALASVANFVCEMDVRLEACGLMVDDVMPLPLLQADLAEVAGLSTVHVNRVCRGLREAGLCTLRDGSVRIHDRVELRRLAAFDPGYIYPTRDSSI